MLSEVPKTQKTHLKSAFRRLLIDSVSLSKPKSEVNS